MLFPSEVNSCTQTEELMRIAVRSLSLAIKQYYPLFISLTFIKDLVFVGEIVGLV